MEIRTAQPSDARVAAVLALAPQVRQTAGTATAGAFTVPSQSNREWAHTVTLHVNGATDCTCARSQGTYTGGRRMGCSHIAAVLFLMMERQAWAGQRKPATMPVRHVQQMSTRRVAL